MKRLFLVLLLVIIAIPTSSFAEIGPEKVTYKLAISSKVANEKLAAGIEGAVEDMNFITRPIARSRLKKTNTIYKTISFKIDGDKILIQYENIATIIKTNGKPEKWTRADGEEFMVTHKKKGNVITQKFVAEDGEKVLTYVFSKDYSRMNLSVKLKSEKLGGAMSYMVSYKK